MTTMENLYSAWLFAWCAGSATALGGLVVVAIAEVSGASWMLPFRRTAEAVAATLPAFAALFVVTAVFARHGFPWAGSLEHLPHEVKHAIEVKRRWLSIGPFVARGLFYFAVWILFAELLRRASVQQDQKRRGSLFVLRRKIAGASLPFILLTATFASFDWIMSLTPHWSSSVLGFIFLAGGFDSALAIAILAAYRKREAIHAHMALRPAHWHAIGTVLFAGVMVWAYVSFSQVLIHWIADIPREIEWYFPRYQPGGWRAIAYLVGFVHFAIPWLMLLSRVVKRNPGMLAVAAVLVVIGHVLDFALLIVPSAHVPHPTIADGLAVLLVAVLAAPLGWLRFRRAAPVPINDQNMPRALRFEMP